MVTPAVVEKFSLFRDDPALRQSGTYVIKADVSPEVFRAFVHKATDESAVKTEYRISDITVSSTVSMAFEIIND